MTDHSRLIEHAFPLKQTSLDSVHEKNVRHGHISTMHIWPARRPLAASRAAIIATLLPDPGTPEARQTLCEKIGGRVVKKLERKAMPNGSTVEREKLVTDGGILHWNGEPKSDVEKRVVQQQLEDLEWFRQEIRRAYGGRAPKVLDPFAGGGAIPLEAMRLGCDATAVDINPVAWLILKCTLEYSQGFAGQVHKLPDFALRDAEFMAEFFSKAKGMTKSQTAKAMERLGRKAEDGEQTNLDFGAASGETDADLAWHLRAWGRWVRANSRRELAKYYPTYADFEPLKDTGKPYERQPMRLVPDNADGVADVAMLNREFSADYLASKGKPRWIAKPTVAYLWARTIKCKNCRAAVPLLKSRWLCKKVSKRTLLGLSPRSDGTGVTFSIEVDVPLKGGNAAQTREHDRRISQGTMSRAGVKCPCCPAIMTMADIRVQGKAGDIGEVLTAVMIDTPDGRGYRLPTAHELAAVDAAKVALPVVFSDIPGGVIDEPLRPASSRSISCDLYGLDNFGKLFSARQQVALGTLIRITKRLHHELRAAKLDDRWCNALYAYLSLNIDRVADRLSTFCRPDPTPTQSGVINTFSRFALPMTWDYIEGVPLADTSGGYVSGLEWIALVVEHLLATIPGTARARVIQRSATEAHDDLFDLVITDPPYYEAISYADLSDFFYVWQRRLHADKPEFAAALTNKNFEAVQHVRSDKNRDQEKHKYEQRMADAFRAAHASLTPEGRFVVVFAHKQPDAWETLVTAMIQAGFVVTSSWPIQTEMPNRGRALSSAALASSVWLVCRKRPIEAKVGWDNKVIDEMRESIGARLHEYWDAGIKGPDFIWAATGPALEAFSKHPVVRKANGPGTMSVTEFLSHVRRLVVDYVVGQVLSGRDGDVGSAGSGVAADRLDEPTAYYLLHRNDFGLGEAPVGTVILYAVSCGLSDRDLVDTWELAIKVGDDSVADDEGDRDDSDEADDAADDDTGGKSSTIRLRRWSERTTARSGTIGYEAPGGRPVPLIDRVHRLLQLYKAGDIGKVDEFLDEHGLRRHDLFKRVIQSLIEVSRRERGTAAGGRDDHGDETTLLEALSIHIGAKGAKRQTGQRELGDESGTWSAATSAEAE